MPLLKKIVLLLFLSATLFAQPKREFRGIWIANVGNVDWPSQKGLSVEEQQQELIDLLDLIKRQGLNAVFFQIRNACDAVYESNLEPWSEWLTGQQGRSPGYDPLAFAIQECRKRNLEIHAWMNPYRAVTDIRSASLAPNHVAQMRPDVLLAYGPLRILDPGRPEVRSFVTRVVMDVVRRYDIDGIHFDDYFYPYPQKGLTLNDNATFANYNRGITNRADWRRDNVNLLIKAVSDSIHRVKPWVKFGVSPFGIWKNRVSSLSEGSDSRGFEAFSGNFADSRKWVDEGWVDYIAPQVYWSMGNGRANYSTIVPWWNETVSEQHLYIGHGVYKVNSDANWRKPLEVPNQIQYNRTFPNVQGSILFSAKTLRNNPNRVSDALLENVYQTTALIPTMPWKNMTPPPAPTQLDVQLNDNNTITLKWSYPFPLTSERDKARYFVLYRSVNQSPIDLRTGQCIRATVVKTDGKTLFTFTDQEVKPGTKYNYTISAVNRLHNESQPTEVVSIKTDKKAVEIVEVPQKQILPLLAQSQPTTVQPHFEEPMEAVAASEEKAEETVEEPESDELLQVFPNPFNQQISIRYRITAAADVSLYVYDSRGTRVGALVVNKPQEVGNYSVNFNGQFLSEGTYYARLMAGEIQKTAKMVLKR
jgi:uncharacterized lipoprotein YddW (UPF0748 family)